MNWPVAWAYPAATSLGGPSRLLANLFFEEFKSGRITKPELRLGCSVLVLRYQLDGFLKSHDVYEDYTAEDFELDRDALKGSGY